MLNHPPVGNDGALTDGKTASEPFHHGGGGRHIGGVARPHLGSDGGAFPVEDDAHDHLETIGPVFLAVTRLADRTSLAFKVERGGVEEDEIEGGEQILAVVEELLLDDVLRAPHREGVIHLVLDLTPQKGHGPVEVVEVYTVHTLDDVIPASPVTGAVGAGGEEPMEDGEEGGALHVETESPSPRRCRSVHAHLLPEPLEDESRAGLLCVGMKAVRTLRQNKQHVLGEAGKGTGECFYCSFRPKH